MAPRATLAAIVIAYLALAVWYALAIPLGQAPDESAHLLYVTYLADHHRPPVFSPVGAGGYEYHQPPLYYALSLPAYLLAPRQSAYLGVRLFNVLLGVGVILFTYLLCRELFPRRLWRAAAAAGFVAFLPMHVALCASVTNDVLAEVIFTAGLWLMVRHLRVGWSRGASVAVGALVGLGLLTKSATAPLLAVGGLAAVLALSVSRDETISRRRVWVDVVLSVRFLGLLLLGLLLWVTVTAQKVRQVLRRLLAIAADLSLLALAAEALIGWWLVRNQVLYGDPLAAGAFEAAFRDRPTPSYFLDQQGLSLGLYILLVLGVTFASFWGVFGTMDVFMPTGLYVALGVFSGAVLLGLVLRLRRWQRLEGWQRQAVLTLGFAALLVGMVFVRFNMSYYQAQARYLFPVIGVFSIGMVWGISALVPARARMAVAFLPVAVALALALVALPTWILPQMMR